MPFVVAIVVLAALGYGMYRGSKQAPGPSAPPQQPPPNARVLPAPFVARWAASATPLMVGSPVVASFAWGFSPGYGGSINGGPPNAVLAYLAPDGNNAVVQITDPSGYTIGGIDQNNAVNTMFIAPGDLVWATRGVATWP